MTMKEKITPEHTANLRAVIKALPLDKLLEAHKITKLFLRTIKNEIRVRDRTMPLSQLGREGLLDDTKPLLREKAIYNKLENNDTKIRKDPKGAYKEIKEQVYDKN